MEDVGGAIRLFGEPGAEALRQMQGVHAEEPREGVVAEAPQGVDEGQGDGRKTVRVGQAQEDALQLVRIEEGSVAGHGQAALIVHREARHVLGAGELAGVGVDKVVTDKGPGQPHDGLQ